MKRQLVPLFVGIFLLACPARAESADRDSAPSTSASYKVIFDDDALLAPGPSPYASWLKVRPPFKRVMLVRPRTSFVPELVTSVHGF